MSADDGYIIRKKVNGKYVLHHYFASDEELPDIDSQPSAESESLEAVVLEYNRLEDKCYPSEYGLRLALEEV